MSTAGGQGVSRQTVTPRPQRPSLVGGMPARQRELGAHGRETVRRLLDAGLAEFEESGLQGARVEDIVRRAKTSHGTFYLYFANKDDLFRTLLQDALHDMANITDDFPIVTSNDAGRAALRRWVQSFCDTYAVHATVIRILSQAEIVGESVFADGLQQLFRLSEAMTQGMTAAAGKGSDENRALPEHAELDGGRLPDDARADQLPAQRGRGQAAQGRDDRPRDGDHLRRVPLLIAAWPPRWAIGGHPHAGPSAAASLRRC